MKDWITHFLQNLNPAADSTGWTLGAEGMPSGWAFFIFLLLMGWVAWSVVRQARQLAPWRKILLLVLRGAALAIVLILLAKPVLNLTLNEPIHQNFLVLVDSSQSMALQDKRERPEDLKRAALASGLNDPKKGLESELPASAAALGNVSRWDLLQRLSANPRLDLWSRLSAKCDLSFYRFGREATPWATFSSAPDQRFAPGDVERLFAETHPSEPGTAIGESLRQVLRESRGQPLAGVLLISDGCNNSGLPPIEAAQLAREENVPLFCYGVGITSPPDLSMQDLNVPQMALLKERVEVTAKIRQQGFAGKNIVVTLKANGKTVDQQPLRFGENEEYSVTFGFVAEEMGDLKLEASIPEFPEEIAKNNNTATAKLRVIDSKVHVLYLEQQPRWDYRYLLSFLEEDRHVEVRCCLLSGEPKLDQIKGSVFLPGLPDDRATFFKSEILILGDMDPAALGETRMKIIREWVEQGGGIVFLSGPSFNPGAYAGTPLEPLLPVVPDRSQTTAQSGSRAADYFPLKRTVLGETSPYLKMADKPAENQKIWNGFAGVRWTAPAAGAKPGAQVLLTDSRPERATQEGPLPVVAIQQYGSGSCIYIGTDETYRWRSRKGGIYYTRFWGQIMQSLSMERLRGASALTQIKSDRQQYYTGEKVIISGKIYNEGFEPLTAPMVEAVLKTDKEGQKGTPVTLLAVEGQKGEYRAELTPGTAGSYRFSTLRDPNAVVKFDVQEANFEAQRAAMEPRTLQAMAETARGQFLREEDLDRLPGLIASKSATFSTFRKIELYYSPWWAAALALCLAGEWLVRRLSQLK